MPTPPNTELAQFGLTEQDIQHTLGVVKVRDVDYADLYVESCLSESACEKDNRHCSPFREDGNRWT